MTRCYWYCVARASDGKELGRFATMEAAVRKSRKVYGLVYLRPRRDTNRQNRATR